MQLSTHGPSDLNKNKIKSTKRQGERVIVVFFLELSWSTSRHEAKQYPGQQAPNGYGEL